VEAAAERGAKTMLLTIFDDTYTSKPKHPIKLYARVSYFEFINHLRQQYMKLHQLNITELMSEMKDYYDVNEGISKYFEKMKNDQTIATAVDRDLINDATLLQIGLDAMYVCGLFEKTLDEWEELNKTDQTWNKFQTHFIAAEEKFNLKKGIHDKKG